NGQWRNIKEVALAPKHASTMHPTVTADGKRLFFASDMPGTFGKYDIYVAAIQSNGSVGVAKNLGEKVNTDKNELYPNLAGGTTLFFASEGREGYGGLDVFMVQVNNKKVSWAVNLGNPINSEEDDFSIFLMADKGEGYVMSNRGKDNGTITKVAFSYTNKGNNQATEKREYNLLEALNNDLRIDYSSSVFDNE
ncbi:MAG: cell envelope biogenesis protein OmpA, partial [Flavobacteriales bacterium]